jgi:hypothetical protein
LRKLIDVLLPMSILFTPSTLASIVPSANRQSSMHCSPSCRVMSGVVLSGVARGMSAVSGALGSSTFTPKTDEATADTASLTKRAAVSVALTATVHMLPGQRLWLTDPSERLAVMAGPMERSTLGEAVRLTRRAMLWNPRPAVKFRVSDVDD